MPPAKFSLTRAAAEVGVAPRTLKDWHRRGLLSADQIGRKGVPWRFDATTLTAEAGLLPRCAYEGCDRPTAEERTGCREHRLAVETQGKPRPAEIVEKVAASLRKHQDGDHHCDECGTLLNERRGWKIAKRRAKGDGKLRCGSCAAKRRHQEQPYKKGRWRHCPTCGGGPDWVQPCQEHLEHCSRCFNTAPDVREAHRVGMLAHVATPAWPDHLAAMHTQLAGRNAAIAEALSREGLVGTSHASELLVGARSSATRLRLTRDGRLTVERREFGGLVRLAVPATDLVDVSLAETGSTAVAGKLNKQLAAAKGKRVGRPREVDDDVAERIRERCARGQSQRQIAQYVGVSRAQVRSILAAQKVG